MSVKFDVLKGLITKTVKFKNFIQQSCLSIEIWQNGWLTSADASAEKFKVALDTFWVKEKDKKVLERSQFF